jgi:hypothetical protein
LAPVKKRRSFGSAVFASANPPFSLRYEPLVAACVALASWPLGFAVEGS